MARREPQELSELATERITRVVHTLVEDGVERGIDLSRPMHCDSCDQERAPAGSALYGAYRLCNQCLLDFTLALASGQVENVAEYMTRRSDGFPPSDLTTHRDRPAYTVNPVVSRDKLVPRNEPC